MKEILVYWVYMTMCQQLGQHAGLLWKARLGLPCAACRQFQLAPMVLPQGKAGPSSKDGGTSRRWI